ncbi:MAG: hypothetical protein LBK43_01970 [Treponema sp.]|jgi:hypothetical protein|nr:hypothetical protein [Treponema sp.]
MKKNVFFMGMLVMVLVFGLVFITCSTDSDDDDDNGDPISVDLSLPRIEDVPSFSGTFVSNETDAKNLVQAAFEEIGGISPVQSEMNSVRSISRSVYSEPYEEIFDHDTTVLSGAEVTGFVQGKETMSAADDENAGESVGDYMEMSMRIKLAVDFQDITKNDSIIKGKYSVDEDMYLKAQITTINPPKGDLTISCDVSDGYAISISKNNKGLKFVMRLQGKVDKKMTGQSTSILDNLDIGNLFETYKLSLDVYDNANVKQEKYSKTFTSYAEAATYLGIN